MPSERGTTWATSAEAAETAIRCMQAPCWGWLGERRAEEMATFTGPPACLGQWPRLSGILLPCR